MEQLEGFKRVIRRITYSVCAVGMFLAIPLMLITTSDVISRGFFNKPIPGTLELSEYMLSIIILLGAAYTQQVKGHVGVDFLTKRFSKRTQSILEVFTTLASMLIIAIMIWQGYVEGIHEKTVSDMLRVPQWPFRLLVAVGGFMLLLELFIDLFSAVARVRRKITE
ncbi:MAG TPA: TRAP transporter small permease [Syntrophorhabdus sp.]|jgi:TRAP-type C4-dicarboxylate transport system permease small subunit|nr:TRAP transporter small permease [Syntrophorhabdus sp.]MDI9557285.1 TRAP transporter small permease [Pseudomonadota bacterium]OPX93060.1 MAG: Tripartite ATP-independent periplasmic transporter [Syntrophorhabdus sp. PtaB.Bin027]OQB77499.1 MAG: Tripartite ATP-independent periplasmic transporter [Deltaproteobacteria bacterium ADurb.Bin135]HNQ46517.1 TRAP transporter small permease [Syntrophorhabdus sp.]